MDTTAILRTIRARLICAARAEACAAAIDALQADSPEARRLRRLASHLRAEVC